VSARALALFLRALILALVCGSIAVAGVACGRSDLDDYLTTDGGPLPDGFVGDGPLADGHHDGAVSCDIATCPTGCCDTSGTCQTGILTTQCGVAAEACVNCTADGFQTCDPTHHACANTVTVCNASTCSGCCIGNTCFAGTEGNECGGGGQTCQACLNEGLVCTNRECVTPPACGPGTCAGCCFGGTCIPGTDQTACGSSGQQCVNCVGQGDSCQATGAGGACVVPPPCGPATCAGCCVGSSCVAGNSATACGVQGQACVDCAQFGDACNNAGQCVGGPVNCGPQNCSGCCLGDACVPGTDSSSCGFGGNQCTNCSSFGASCQGQECSVQPTCSPANCNGCCDFQGICQPGTFDTECGHTGQSCEVCTTVGETCQSQTCSPGSGCNPTNCNGCCDSSGKCEGGSSGQACGFGGQVCGNCSAFGEICQNQTCFSTCNDTNCGGCCDGNGVCQQGSDNGECGFGGQTCQSCTSFNETCQFNQCLSACNPQNCEGCCDSTQTCQPGFLDTQCGGFGGSCTDCATLSPPSTCNQALFPPTCASQQMTCPSPYPGCAATTTTNVPFAGQVCSANDLANAAAACASGPDTSACENFFNFEFSQNPNCGTCLEPFNNNFFFGATQQQGVDACIAQFVSSTCNHQTGCNADCDEQSCETCEDQTSFTQCTTTVGTGQCSTFSQAAQACEQGAFTGAGKFCDPSQYSNYGTWLQGVGKEYCGGLISDAGIPDSGFPLDAGFGSDF
jgi:hypothetical protein